MSLKTSVPLNGSDVSDYDLARFYSKISTEPDARGCLNWTGSIDRAGYGLLWMTSTAKKKNHALAHRLAYAIKNGQTPAKLSVMHSCDNRRCVNPSHLSLGTHLENMRDCFRKGRRAALRGEKNGHTHLDTWDVICIRADRRKLTEIAADYGIAFCSVSAIKRRRNWAHVPEFTV